MSINDKKRSQTIKFNNRPYITGTFSVGGCKEKSGPLSTYFDYCLENDSFGEKTWEKSESKMLKLAVSKAVERSGLQQSDIDAMLSGDLLNQLMSSSFMARDLQMPFLGLYGACSTMAEAMLLGAVLVDGKYAGNVVSGVSSHYCTAERQFRMPLEHGNQRPPSAQWTATAAGAVTISDKPLAETNTGLTRDEKFKKKCVVRITCGTIGKIVDAGIKDANQMGAAMAPAAVDTILNHFQDTGHDFDDYDLVLTGDLGFIGKDIAKDLFADAGYSMKSLEKHYDDCGAMIYEPEQDIHGGGSGCGCSASVYAGYVYKLLQGGDLKRVLLTSTGALLSTISPFQGESIPGIAHCIVLEAENM